MEIILTSVLNELSIQYFSYRMLVFQDIQPLYNFIHSQKKSSLEYFNPHGFDFISLKKQLKNPSFLMMGVFFEKQIIGYFFLRFFILKKCFVGRLVDEKFRGKGIGAVMNYILYETAWRTGFRCMSTISRSNIAVINAHKKNPNFKLIKNLPNNYLLVEFIKPSDKVNIKL
jgi:GNAT superfamily N-acetyltransferase